MFSRRIRGKIFNENRRRGFCEPSAKQYVVSFFVFFSPFFLSPSPCHFSSKHKSARASRRIGDTSKTQFAVFIRREVNEVSPDDDPPSVCGDNFMIKFLLGSSRRQRKSVRDTLEKSVVERPYCIPRWKVTTETGEIQTNSASCERPGSSERAGDSRGTAVL